MLAWLKRFGLHMAAAIGATGIFVAAAAVGASQTRQQAAALGPAEVLTQSARATPTPGARRKPSVVVTATPTPSSDLTQTRPAPPQSSQPVPTQAQASPTQARPGPTQPPPGLAAAPPDESESQPDQAEAPPDAVQTQPGPPQSAAAPGQAQAPGAPNGPTPRPGPARRTPTPTPLPAPASDAPPSGAATTSEKVVPERSLAGTIKDVMPDGLDVMGVGGREWRVAPAAGALIRLNGKAARLDALHVGDTVVILGQAQPNQGPVNRFLAHAITARRK